MRIGLDLQAAMGESSGLGSYAQGLAEALPRWAPEHTLIPLRLGPTHRLPAVAQVAREQLWLRLAAWARQLDVLHAPAFALPFRSRAARVVTVHDLSVLDRPDLLPPGMARWYWSRWLPRAVAHADLVLTPSRFTAARVRRHLRLPAERLRVIPYPPRALFARPAAEQIEAVSARYGLDHQFTLAIGAIEWRKDWVALLRAFALLATRRPGPLVIAGRVNVPAAERAFEAEVRRLGLRERVRRLGYVPEGDLPALCSAATLMVFPETYAGYGLPVLEAMACQTPVLSFRNTALQEVAGGAALLVPPPHSPEQIAQAWDWLLGAPDVRQLLAQAGRRRVRALSWQQTVASLLDAYGQAMELRRRGAARLPVARVPEVA